MQSSAKTRSKPHTKGLDLSKPLLKSSIEAVVNHTLAPKSSDEPTNVPFESPQDCRAFSSVLRSSFGSLRSSIPHVQEQEGLSSRHDINSNLLAQLNLLRERSWSEQQLLRRQCDELEALNEQQRKQLEQTCSQLLCWQESKGALLGAPKIMRETPVKDSLNSGTNRPNPTDDEDQKECERLRTELQDLKSQLSALCGERQKEQEDLKELEQVINAFHIKMENLKKENKNLKLQVSTHQRNHATISNRENKNSVTISLDTDVLAERMSMHMLRRQNKIQSYAITWDTFRLWHNICGSNAKRVSPASDEKNPSRPNFPDISQKPPGGKESLVQDSFEDHSDHVEILNYRLQSEKAKCDELRAAMDSAGKRAANLVESEREQSARIAQRLMKADDMVAAQNLEITHLRKELDKLEALLKSTQGQLLEERHCEDPQKKIFVLEAELSCLHLSEECHISKLIGCKEKCSGLLMKRLVVSDLRSVMWIWSTCILKKRQLQASIRRHQKIRKNCKLQTLFHAWAGIRYVPNELLVNSEKKLAEISRAFEDLQTDSKKLRHQLSIRQESETKASELTITAEQQRETLQKTEPILKNLEDQNAALSNDLNQAKLEVSRLTSQLLKLQDLQPQLLTKTLRKIEQEERIKWKTKQSDMSVQDAELALLREQNLILSSKLEANEADRKYLIEGLNALKELQEDMNLLQKDIIHLLPKPQSTWLADVPISFDPATQITKLILMVRMCRESLTISKSNTSIMKKLFCNLLVICENLCSGRVSPTQAHSHLVGLACYKCGDLKVRESDLLAIAALLSKGTVQIDGDTRSNDISAMNGVGTRSDDCHLLLSGAVSMGEHRKRDLTDLLQEFIACSQRWLDSDRVIRDQQDCSRIIMEQESKFSSIKMQYQSELQAKQQTVSALSAKLALLQNDNLRLQTLIDGTPVFHSYESSVKFLQDMILNLNSKLGKKAAYCEQLDQQLQELSQRSLVDTVRRLECYNIVNPAMGLCQNSSKVTVMLANRTCDWSDSMQLKFLEDFSSLTQIPKLQMEAENVGPKTVILDLQFDKKNVDLKSAMRHFFARDQTEIKARWGNICICWVSCAQPISNSSVEEADENSTETPRHLNSKLRQELAALRQANDQISKEMEALHERCKHAVGASSALTSQLDEISLIWRRGFSDVMESKSELQNCEQELKSAQIHLEDCTRELKNQKADNQVLLDEKKRTNSDLHCVINESVSLKTTLDRVTSEMETLSAVLAKSEVCNVQLLKNISDLEDRLSASELNLSVSNSALEDCRKSGMLENKAVQGRLRALSNQNGKIIRELPAILLHLQGSSEDLQMLQVGLKMIDSYHGNACMKLIHQIREQDELIITLQRENSQASSDLEQNNSIRRKVEVDNERLRSELMELTIAHDDALQELSSLQHELTSHEHENRVLQSRIQDLCFSLETIPTLHQIADRTCTVLNILAKSSSQILETHKMEIAKLTGQRNDEQQKAKFALEKLTHEQMNSAALLAHAQTAETTLSALQQKCGHYDKCHNSIIEEMAAVSVRILHDMQLISRRYTELETAHQGNSAVRKQLEGKFSETISKLQSVRSSEQQLSTMVKELQLQVVNLEGQVISTDEKNQMLHTANVSDNNELLKLRALVQELSSHGNDLQTTVEKKAKDSAANIARLMAQLELQNQCRVKFEDEKSYLQERITHLKVEISSREAVSTKLRKSAECLQTEIFTLQDTIYSLSSLLQSREDTVEFLGEKCLSATRSMAALNESLDQQRHAHEELLASKQALECEIIDSNTAIECRIGTMEMLVTRHMDEIQEISTLLSNERHGHLLIGSTLSVAESIVTATAYALYLLRSQLATKITPAESILKDLRVLNIMLDEMRVETFVCENAMKSKEMESKIAKREVQILQKDLESARFQREEYLQSLETAKQNTESLALELADTVASNLDLTGQIEANEKLKAKLEAQLAEISSHRSEQNAVIAQMQTKTSELQQQLSHLAQINLNLQQSESNLNSELQDLRERLHAQDQQLERCRADLNEKEMQKAETEMKLVEQILTAENSSKEYERKTSEVVGELETAISKLLASRTQCENLTSKVNELEEDVSRSRDKIFEYERILQAKGKEIAKLHGNLAEANSLATEAQERLHALQEQERTRHRSNLRNESKSEMSHAGSLDINRSIQLIQKGVIQDLQHNATLPNFDMARRQEMLVRNLHSLSSSNEDFLVIAEDKLSALEETLLNVFQVLLCSSEIEHPTRRDREDFALFPSERMCEKMTRFLMEATSALTDCQLDVQNLEKFVLSTLDTHEKQLSDDGHVKWKAKKIASSRMWNLKRRVISSFRVYWEIQTVWKHSFAGMLLRLKQRRGRKEAVIDENQRLESEVDRLREEARLQILELQRQIVDKSDSLLASERKFAQLLAWVQKEKGKVKSR